ncbi:MAG: hypothetical protein ACO1SX_14480 [Actinomycetota bacterium]
MSIQQGRVRFMVGVPHPTATAEGFAVAAGRNAKVRKALGSHARLLHVTSQDELDKDGDRDHCDECEAVYYDYAKNRTVHVRGNAAGAAGHQITYSHHQPAPSPDEFEDAVALIRQSEVWGPMLQSEQVQPYRPMPPMLEPLGDEQVERTLYVGLISKPRQFNRIVAVNMVRRTVSPEPVRPRGSMAAAAVCGVQAEPCIRPRWGTPGTLTLEWPAENPVWRFQAIRPSASSGTNASGIELRNVRYKGKRVLKQAHIPILNVQYDNDECGPYRDWMYEETCFQANGTDIPGANGFRWCTSPPQTVFDSGQDGGNFVGVAVYEAEDGSLRLISQLSAGWYRYIPEFRFYPDGRILPRFRFGGTDNSCVCHVHHHHAFWRFDFDIFTPQNRVQELVDGNWRAIKREAHRSRTPGVETRWRVLHRNREIGYEIISGADDGVADEFSGPDQFALRYRKQQIDDGHLKIIEAQANLTKFVNKQSVQRQDSVIWYAGHYNHDVGDNDEHTTEVGPTLAPINWPD